MSKREWTWTYTPQNPATAIWEILRLVMFIVVAIHLGWSILLLALIIACVEVKFT